MPRRKRGGDLASSAAKRRKQKEKRRNETEEEREARLQNQRTRMSTLRSGKSEERKENKSFGQLYQTVFVMKEGEVGVGRLVESSQADDRRVIALVRERPLLYTRTTLPVASYYAQVRHLWQEVADHMGWTASEVRRKWSHIRNSYSRHLRNELADARTGRGRRVSRWYLADELTFLREHMATDVRGSNSFSLEATSMLKMELNEPQPEPVPGTLMLGGSSAGAGTGGGSSVASWDERESFLPHESSSYFEFFRGMYREYEELEPRGQRAFKRQCLALLHAMLDEQEDMRRHNNLIHSDDRSENDRSDRDTPEQKVIPHLNEEVFDSGSGH